jgi:hypothetical protein
LGHRSAPSTTTRRAATSRRRSLAPARPAVGAEIDNQAINTVMVSKFTQGGEKLDDVIKWAENEFEGTLRARRFFAPRSVHGSQIGGDL